jgi:AcrR family transcriptional regulator
MARKPVPPRPAAGASRNGGAARPASAASGGGKSERERVIEAFMALLAEKPFEQIGFAEIATRAGVSLSELRNLFGSTLAIVAAFLKDIDRAVLAGGEADMAEEPPRERLFDVLMRRIEALTPHKAAVRSLARSARCNPGLALALNGLTVQSQQWMLTAADISAAGPKGMVRAQGLQMLYASVLRTWLDDDDPGLARTMAALDRALARGQRWSGFLDEVCRIPAALGRLRPRRGRGGSEDETIAA